MNSFRSVELDDDERDTFLEDGGTGVMSFATESLSEPPHSIPVSYGYDATDTTFYFRLAIDPDSDKGDVTDRSVSFVTYGEGDDGWRSVVAHGRLEDVTEDGIATESLEGLERVDIPLIDIFEDPTKVVSFGFFRLVPDTLTGRKEADT